MPINVPDSGLVLAVRNRSALTIIGAGVTRTATADAVCSTWYGLLSQGLIFCGSRQVEFEGERGLERMRADLEATDLLSAADKLQRALEHSGQLAEFMRSSIGELSAIEPAVFEAVQSLDLPALTTNYDTLFATTTKRHAVTWLDREWLSQVLDDPTYVLHIHGVWTRLESVVLGAYSYGRIGMDEWVHAVDSAVSVTKQMVFIGCGRTILDPHFATALRNAGRLSSSLYRRHYWLLTEDEAAQDYVLRACQDLPTLKAEVYGSSFADLMPYLYRLAELSGRKRRRLQHEILAVPLLPGRFSERLKLRSVYPHMLVEPVVESRTLFGAKVGLWQWYTGRPPGARYALVGAGGAGKSTALRALTLRETQQVRLITASDSLESLESAAIVFIDGLDEVSPERRAEVLGWAGRQETEIWLGCRRDVFQRDPRLANEVYEDVLIIQPFEVEESRYVAHGIAALLQLSEVATEFDRLVQDRGVQRLVTNPLSLVILIFLLAESARGLLGDIRTDSRFGLFSSFYDYVLDYEVARGEGTVSRTVAEKVHLEAALRFFESAGAMTNYGPVDERCVLGAGLLIETTGEASSCTVTGFVHESIRAFIAARAHLSRAFPIV